MKIEMKEYDGSFAFNMKAETVQDAAMLARWGINRTRRIVCAGAYADKSGEFSGYLTIAKRKHQTSHISQAHT